MAQTPINLLELPDSALLTERESAEALRWSTKTLQRRRWLRQPPEFIKVGASVRYTAGALKAVLVPGQPPSAA